MPLKKASRLAVRAEECQRRRHMVREAMRQNSDYPLPPLRDWTQKNIQRLCENKQELRHALMRLARGKRDPGPLARGYHHFATEPGLFKEVVEELNEQIMLLEHSLNSAPEAQRQPDANQPQRASWGGALAPSIDEGLANPCCAQPDAQQFGSLDGVLCNLVDGEPNAYQFGALDGQMAPKGNYAWSTTPLFTPENWLNGPKPLQHLGSWNGYSMPLQSQPDFPSCLTDPPPLEDLESIETGNEFFQDFMGAQWNVLMDQPLGETIDTGNKLFQDFMGTPLNSLVARLLRETSEKNVQSNGERSAQAVVTTDDALFDQFCDYSGW